MRQLFRISGLIVGLFFWSSLGWGEVLETAHRTAVSKKTFIGPLTAPEKRLSAMQSLSPDATHEDWWDRAQQGLVEREYQASKNKHGLQAPNRAHNLRTYFQSNGIKVHDRTAKGSPELTSLSLTGLGRGATLPPVAVGVVAQAGARVEIRRGDVVEWYENSAQGLEQGFDLQTRPPSEGPLVLELQVEGASAALAGKSVILATHSGRRLNYGGLIAEDSNGKILESRLEVPGPQSVRLVINDSNAVYPLIIDPLLTQIPDTILESNQPDSGSFDAAVFGGSVSSAGDVNGDGFADVIVGARGWDNGLFDEGAAFVYLGSASGLAATPNAVIQSSQASSEFGVSVAGAGDVNGDGFGDIIVGSNHFDGILPGTSLLVDGAAFVFYGGALGITATDPSMADATIQANQISSFLGFSVAGAGDVNGDGFGDIVVGVPRQGSPTFPPNIPINQGQGTGGAALVFHGSNVGITGTGFDDADAVLLPYPAGLPEPSGTLMGAHVSGAGDVNGDGFDDVILNANGAVVFLGSSTGIVGTDPTTAHAHIQGPGNIVSSAGDVNGDGFADIIVGNPGFPNITPGLPLSDSGKFGVFLGSAGGITATDFNQAQTFVEGTIANQQLGIKVDGAGDIDNDGFDDVIVGTFGFAGSLDFEGAAYVFRGGPTGIAASVLSDAFVRLRSNQSEATIRLNRHEVDVAGAGDVNGDGFADVILGLGFYDVDQLNEGAAFVYLGGSTSVTPNQPPVAVAGADQVLLDIDNSGAETVTLKGSASFDPEGSPLSYRWLEGETLLGTTAILTTDLTTIGDHTLTLTVTDVAGLTRGDPVVVRVEQVPNVSVAFDDFSTVDFGWTGDWISSGDVLVSNFGASPTPPQARLGGAGAITSRSAALPVGATGINLRFWGKASQFAASDQLLVQVSIDGGPFTTIKTFASADSDDIFNFHNLNFSWFPTTAANVTIRFESLMTTGLFFFDDIGVRALVAPTSNQNPTANAGVDQVVTDTDNSGSETITVDGSGSSDLDGSVASFVWNEGATQLGTTALLTTTLPVGDHTLTLTVTDNIGATNSDTVAVSVVAPITSANLAADGFESGNFSGGTGSWVAGWSNGGDVRVQTNGGPHSGSRHVRLRKSNAFLRRTVNLLGAQGVHLNYWGKARRFGGSDQVLVKVSIDGGPFTTVETITSADSDNTYHPHDIDLSALSMTSNVRIEFDSNMNKGVFFIDDVEIMGSVGPTPNQAPIANAGVDQVATDQDGNGLEIVTLNGSASSDVDGSIASYQWSEGGIGIGSGVTLAGVSLNLGVHSISLTVTDNNGATSTDSLIIIVNQNQAPIANAGVDQVVTDSDNSGAETVTLDGSASSDVDGSIASFAWQEGATLLGTSALLATPLSVGDHTLTLTVVDNAGASNSDTVAISVVAPTTTNQPPVANAGVDQTAIDLDGNGLETVTLDGSASSDTDGTIVSYAWSEGGIGIGSGVTLANASFGLGVHSISLTVTDNNGATATDSLVITVNPNQAPVANAGADQVVADTDSSGAETVTLDGGASSDVDGAIVSFTWREGATLLGTSALLATPLSVGDHTLTLTVVDNAGASNSDTVLVTVNNAAALPQGTVAIGGPASISRGDNVSFTVTLTNTGSSTMTNAVLTFNVSSGQLIKDLSPGNSVAVGNILPGGSITQTWSGQGGKEGSATVTTEAFSEGVSIATATQSLTVLK